MKTIYKSMMIFFAFSQLNAATITVTGNITSNTNIPNKPISIFIHTVDGKLVQTQNKIANDFMTIDISKLQNAVYIITLIQNNELVIRQKFVKK